MSSWTASSSDGCPKSTGERSAEGAFPSLPGEDEVVGMDCGDDPDSKKKRRQMRNKDSAIKSRERKKLYVKDLEMKSKYLEAECCRLSYALQCCAAENMVLRQSLLNRPVGAPTAMQESAVLTETLPLASLLWLGEHRVPIPDTLCAQQKPSGSKQPQKRSCKARPNIYKRSKDDEINKRR
ncbi:hypothetical protein U9M48_025362 [Paspalum notatum var. saurae]|uniref:BZIP domain-containing protein n=1 Tax=Paspalum notatum var. saurae TaxID=547442 RepID=A0AAQ3WX86_PASNO